MVLIDAFVCVSEKGGNRFNFLCSNSVVDGIFERSAPMISFLMALHHTIKDYCNGVTITINKVAPNSILNTYK